MCWWLNPPPLPSKLPPPRRPWTRGDDAVKPNQPWPEPKDNMLRELWAAHSAAQIAIRIGAVSKNAVIGRARRLGLPSKAKPPMAKPACFPPQPRKRRAKPAVPAAPKIIEPTRTLETLGRHECRFPLGAPGEHGFGFCGRQTNGAVYCAAHHAVAYVVSPRRAARATAD